MNSTRNCGGLIQSALRMMRVSQSMNLLSSSSRQVPCVMSDGCCGEDGHAVRNHPRGGGNYSRDRSSAHRGGRDDRRGTRDLLGRRDGSCRPSIAGLRLYDTPASTTGNGNSSAQASAHPSLINEVPFPLDVRNREFARVLFKNESSD